MLRDCKYRLPCGRCEKYNMDCDAPDIPKKHEHNWKFIQQYWDIEKNKFYNEFACTECAKKEIRQPNT